MGLDNLAAVGVEEHLNHVNKVAGRKRLVAGIDS